MATEKKPKGNASNKGKKDRVNRADKAGKESASEDGKSLKTPKQRPASRRAGSPKAQEKEAGKRAAGEQRPRRNPKKKRRTAASESGAPSAADPFEVAKQTMKGSVPAIVEAMVELAKQGSCSHAKTLLEMTGARHMFDSEVELQDSGEPWAKLVLERLDEAETEEAETVAQQKGARLQGPPEEAVAAP